MFPIMPSTKIEKQRSTPAYKMAPKAVDKKYL